MCTKLQNQNSGFCVWSDHKVVPSEATTAKAVPFLLYPSQSIPHPTHICRYVGPQAVALICEHLTQQAVEAAAGDSDHADSDPDMPDMSGH